jgi:FAD/FMN-containing dehydrogenase
MRHATRRSGLVSTNWTTAALAPLIVIALAGGAAAEVVNDVTQQNPKTVARVVEPKSVDEVRRLVGEQKGPISVGGGRYSMGGQIATDGVLFLDMRSMDRVLALDVEKRTVTVEAGITWRKLQEAIDPKGLSVAIMQSYSNFTVGGSLSVNVHGRYVNQGPLVHAVRSISVVLADGRLVEASREQNAEVFFGAIGGYGGLGVIVQATLTLAPNEALERHVEPMAIADYPAYFAREVRGSKTAVLHNADIYPPKYERVETITYSRTDRTPTMPDRLQASGPGPLASRLVVDWATDFAVGKWLREHVFDPWRFREPAVVWRNYEASYDVAGLGPFAGPDFTYELQEYFVPVARFAEFVPRMASVLRRHEVNVVNVSIRHAVADPGTFLAWAPEDVFAFVLFYRQGVHDAQQDEVGRWTRELVDAVLAVGGRYYLPYQIYPTAAQFHAAYPRANDLFALKQRVDPTYKFRNALWDRYFPPTPTKRRAAAVAEVRASLDAREDWRRPEDQTFLTLPEWDIVYSADDYAAFSRHHLPSEFPYLTSAAQFWTMYGDVRRATGERYATNWGYHAMIATIGVSFTAEYVVKALWESTIGRMTELLSLHDRVDRRPRDERFMADVAVEYAAFIHATPWYEFPFGAKLRELWSGPRDDGPWTARAVERRVAATLELAGKTAWAWVIKQATGAAYAPEEASIGAWVKASPRTIGTLPPSVRPVGRLDGRSYLVRVPRFEAFRLLLPTLRADRVRLVEVAGNRTILVTVKAPVDWKPPANRGEVIGEWPLPTDHGRKRVGLAVPVARLQRVAKRLNAGGVTLEHVYDY